MQDPADPGAAASTTSPALSRNSPHGQSLWPGGPRGANTQRVTTLRHEKALPPLCTGFHTCLTLVQTCFLMDILPAARDPGQLAAARRPGGWRCGRHGPAHRCFP